MNTLADISAAILVGGLGTRLRGVVDDRPKPLAPVNGRPFLAYLLDQLVDAGIATVTLCTGYRGESVEEVFGPGYRGLRLEYSREATPLGTGGALRLAAPRLASDPVLVLNGDSYCDTNLDDLLTCYQRHAAETAIMLTQVADGAAYGRVEQDASGWITAFLEKGAAAGPCAINAGIYLISRTRLLAIPADRPISLERDVFPTWVGQGMIGCSGAGGFLDIGTPERWQAASTFLAQVVERRRPPD